MGKDLHSDLKLLLKLRPTKSEVDDGQQAVTILQMSWITVVSSMNAGACLTLAAFYGAVWCEQRENRAYIGVSCSAVAAAVISRLPVWMINARTVYRPKAQSSFL
jgi:hypothetical protein